MTVPAVRLNLLHLLCIFHSDWLARRPVALSERNRSDKPQRRLRHKNIAITLGIYGHVHPSMQEDAAKSMGALLHG